MKVFQNGTSSRIESGLFTPVSSLEGTERERPFTNAISVMEVSIAVLPLSKAACFLKDENPRREPQTFPLSARPYRDQTGSQEMVEPPLSTVGTLRR